MVSGMSLICLMVVGIQMHDRGRRKALSPFIASVILILITIMIGSLLASWSQDFAQDQVDTVNENSRPECNYVFINLVDAEYDNTTTNVLSLILENTGTSDTQINSVQVFYDNFTQSYVDAGRFPLDLEAGGMQPLQFDLADNIKYVQVVSSCPEKSIKIYKSDITFI